MNTRRVSKGSLGCLSKQSLTRIKNLQCGDMKPSEMAALLCTHFQRMI